MEILQTICNVLTTQNERLTNIIISPLIFIEVTLYMLIFLSVLKIEHTRKQMYIFTCLYSVLAIVNILFVPVPYYTFINVLLCPILVFIIFKTSILKCLLSQVIIYISSIIVDTPLVLLSVYALHIDATTLSQTPLYRIIYCLCSYLLTFIIYLLFIKNKIKFFVKDNIKTNGYLFLINLCLGVIAIAVQYYIEFIYIKFLPTYLIILSFIILITYFLISLFSLLRTSKLELTTQSLEEEKLHNQTLTILYDKIRGFKHDFNNIVQGIGGYISTNNMEGLREYYSQVLDDCQRVNNLVLLSPDVINNPAIYSLITAKYHKAMEYGIKIDLEVFMDLTNINMKIYLLTRALGILIDNAIEAAKNSDEKEIIITFRKDIQKHKQLFIIQNTYSNKDVNIDEIFEKGKTTKVTKDSKNHGLGLWEIRQLLKKNHNLNLYTTKTEKYFKQQFEIYC